MRRVYPLLAASLAVMLAGCGVESAAPALPLSTETGRSIAEEALLDTGTGTAPHTGGGAYTTEDLLVPGPAASIVSDGFLPNRIGSAEVLVRRYEPSAEPWGTLVWAHGGSFIHGDLEWPESDWVSSRLAEAGLRVYAVDYALASDRVKAPAPANDVTAALRWVLGNVQGPIAIGGASAGGHLATEAALTVAECAAVGGDFEAQPAALLLQYPTLHRTQRADEGITLLTAGLEPRRQFGADRVAEMYNFYLGDAGAEAPVANTAACQAGYRLTPRVVGEAPTANLSVLPPTVIVNAEADDLRASAEQFAEQLDAAGVPNQSFIQTGTIHGYLNRPEVDTASVAAARATIDTYVVELRNVLGAPNVR
ncbi:alpha/beta hydrolase [Leucobacter sp. GX24907]